ncbi:MAG: hypothetical protein ABJC89_00085 [Acidobacteriota bacterium]
MLRGRFAQLAFAAAMVCVVPSVPAFAQSVIPDAHAEASPAPPPDPDRTRLGVARVFDADALDDPSVTIPQNLIVPSTFRLVVDSMLRGSPTFRRQCLRLANASHITVTLEWYHPSAAEHLRARTMMSITADGRRAARVGIRPIDDPIELIAHEIEHVIEQLDGVDLHVLAAVPTSGVRGCDCRDETFETVRAVRAGLAAADEVRRHGT